MGGVLGSLCRIEKRILVLGLDGSGKTTILNKIKIGEFLENPPTDHYSVHSILYCGQQFLFYDLSGKKECRSFWKSESLQKDVIIFVLDSSDKEERLLEATKELQSFLRQSDEVDPSIPFLVLANKQDLQNTITSNELVEKMNLSSIFKERKWFLQITSAKTGDGLFETMEWLAFGC